MFIGLMLNIKTQLSGGSLRPRHFSLVFTSTSRILFSLRCVNIHFIT
ncbi:hypothetical protein [Citrobacter sp. FDAARGOS_156]|nr:hypothetical protein [Citrobacter sp. FDAARGOS_156]